MLGCSPQELAEATAQLEARQGHYVRLLDSLDAAQDRTTALLATFVGRCDDRGPHLAASALSWS